MEPYCKVLQFVYNLLAEGDRPYYEWYLFPAVLLLWHHLFQIDLLPKLRMLFFFLSRLAVLGQHKLQSTLAFEPQVKRLAKAIPCEHIYLLFIKSQQCHYKVNVVTKLLICCAKVTEWFISMLCFKTSQECPMWAVWALRSVSLCITTSSLLCRSNELGRTTESPITPAMW